MKDTLPAFGLPASFKFIHRPVKYSIKVTACQGCDLKTRPDFTIRDVYALLVSVCPDYHFAHFSMFSCHALPGLFIG